MAAGGLKNYDLVICKKNIFKKKINTQTAPLEL